MDGIDIGNRIKKARKKAGITQKRLAEIVGIEHPTLNRYEKGHRPPTGELIGRISQALNCSPGWLISGGTDTESTLLFDNFQISAERNMCKNMVNQIFRITEEGDFSKIVTIQLLLNLADSNRHTETINKIAKNVRIQKIESEDINNMATPELFKKFIEIDIDITKTKNQKDTEELKELRSLVIITIEKRTGESIIESFKKVFKIK